MTFKHYLWSDKVKELGVRAHPVGEYSYYKDEGYQEDLDDELKHLIDQEQFEKSGGSPFWLADVQKETTHSGESPLFTNKLLATGKYEQEHGLLRFERALLATRQKRLWSAPNRRKAQKQFYRQNRTHQYLSATDLRKANDLNEYVIKYGRPTRATLLRAMQRSNSAPVNAYDIRRENMKRIEDLRNRSIFYTSKEFFNIYSSDGETMHSFLTGARYNRAHLLDSKGLEVYGVYMPRENPAGCFMTGAYKVKDPGDGIPSAPPDSPRSDIEDSPSPESLSRPDSAKMPGSRPTSSRTGSSLPSTRTPSSRPPSYRQIPVARSKSAVKEPQPIIQSIHSLPKSSEGMRRFPEEVMMHVPDHVNPKGKLGVYVTLKGQKMLDTVESKLPRVTGISLPKLRKRHDAVEETLYVNQPPPTPVDISLGSIDRNKFEALHGEQQTPTEPIIGEDKLAGNKEQISDKVPNVEMHQHSETHKEVKFADKVASIVINDAIKQVQSETVLASEEKDNTETDQREEVKESQVVDDTQERLEPKEEVIKTDELPKDDNQESDLNLNAEEVHADTDIKEKKEESEVNKADLSAENDNVVFFVTEEQGEKSVTGTEGIGDNIESSSEESDNEEEKMADSSRSINGKIETVIRVEVTETEKKTEIKETKEPDKAITSENFPFTENNSSDAKDYMV